MKRVILKILKFYKKYISRGNNCRYFPSCSEYTYLAVKKNGVLVGLVRGFGRVLRCNPWSKGGVDWP